MKKSTMLSIHTLLLASASWALPTPAGATTASCSTGDAPFPYNNVTSCSSVCSESDKEWTCDMSTLCTGVGSQAYIVRDASIGHDLVAFGGCVGGGDFCCTFDESSVTTVIKLAGTDYDDEPLAFVWDLGGGGQLNLYPWDSDDIEGIIRGRAGADVIYGSDHGDPDLEERLFGNAGGDDIRGHGGADWLYGGTQDDVMQGGDGADIMVGGDGDDEQYGGEGADTICDTTGESFCASPYGNLMDGGAGADVLWYNQEPTCLDKYLSGSSTGGGGDDECGDDDDWIYTEMPGSCEDYLTAEPTACIVP
jgi:hypothetical protein